MTRLIFQTTQLSVRGTEIALYDYARFNEEVLGNESVVLFNETSPLNNSDVIRKFESRFPVVAYRNTDDIDRAVAGQNADLLYFIKLDRNNFRLSPVVPTMVHEVFPVTPSMFTPFSVTDAASAGSAAQSAAAASRRASGRIRSPS